MREEYTAGPASAKPRPDFASVLQNEVVAAHCPRKVEKKSPAFLGEERRGVYRVRALLFLLFEGKGKLECLILDGDAQHQLLWIFATLEPDRAGNLVVGFDGCRFQRQG
jgi:hypothetical protein